MKRVKGVAIKAKIPLAKVSMTFTLLWWQFCVQKTEGNHILHLMLDPGVRASLCICTPCLSIKSLRKGSKDVQYLGHRIVKKGCFLLTESVISRKGVNF